MQVNVSMPEAEIGRIRGGQRMEFTVDAYPGRTLKGEVLQIRLQPQTSQNAIRSSPARPIPTCCCRA